MPSRERTLKVEAVVLRHSDWGEADRLLGLFSREQGKLRAVAKGARKLRSRKAGHLEPFTRVSLLLARGREFWIVTQAETVDAYLPLRDDLLRTSYAGYVIELLDRFTYEEGENRPIYTLLVDTLQRLSAGDEPFTAVRYYEVRLLDHLGFRPQLFECANCRREVLPEDQFFSFSAGGVICPRCGQGLRNLKPISVETLKYLRHFQRSNYADASRARPSLEVQNEAESLMQGYFTYLLERELNTPGFLKSIKS